MMLDYSAGVKIGVGAVKCDVGLQCWCEKLLLALLEKMLCGGS